ncbi:MAG: hypothetical protein M1817_004281 [Caeruleum heppii]|nr:MAG: hypothetical protein M1817_004281 [Caeruleum heppii]
MRPPLAWVRKSAETNDIVTGPGRSTSLLLLSSARGAARRSSSLFRSKSYCAGVMSPLSQGRERGRSRSPANSETSTPVPIRLRPDDRSVSAVRSTAEGPIPPFLRHSRSEIQEKFVELEWIQRKRLLDGRMTTDPLAPWATEQGPEVKARNRYLNVQPWRNNRIHLHVAPGQCDYINASPIIVTSTKSDQDTRYIATQGPKEGQYNHIWRMIWHETADPAVIVMLTQTLESGRDKCFQYFPLDMDDPTISVSDDGDSEPTFEADVTLLECAYDPITCSTIRKLRLTVGEKSKTVWHFLFAGWPDFGVPEETQRTALLQLISLSAEKAGAPTNPRVVHCSAGVGRSGTFIALDQLLREMDEGAFDDLPEEDGDEQDVIFETVNRLREQRMLMVQSEGQLQFLYQVLKDRWLERQAGGEAGDVPRQEPAEPSEMEIELDDVNPGSPPPDSMVERNHVTRGPNSADISATDQASTHS